MSTPTLFARRTGIAGIAALSLVLLLAIGGCGGGGGGGGGGGNPVALGPPDPLPFTAFETRADGGMRLTNSTGTASDQNPCFSPDGSFLVFTRFDNGYNIGPAHILRLNLDGSSPVTLTTGTDDDVSVPYGAIAQNGGPVVFASDRSGANDFWTVATSPGAPSLTRLSSHGVAPIWIEPVFSPGGAAIAFEQDQNVATPTAQRASVWRLDLPSLTPTQLTNAGGTLDDRLPSWSPDGTTILFQRRTPPSDLWEAFLVPAAGGTATDLSALVQPMSPPRHDTDLSWSPDGRFVATSSDPNGSLHPNIYLLPVAGGQMIRVTNSTDREDGAPCIAPSRLWVAFETHRTSDENSPSDLWIIRLPAPARP